MPIGRPPVGLDNDEIDLFIYYCSGAQQIVRDAKYKSVSLPPELMVGPEYGLTVSRKAQPAAADFARYLMSPQVPTLKSFGFIPVALPGGRSRACMAGIGTIALRFRVIAVKCGI